jgi:ketosteroid isomerase-like protein
MIPVYGWAPGWEASCHTRPIKPDPETLARTYVETITRAAANGRDDEVLELVHPAAELRPIITGDIHRGREGAAAWIRAAREALVWEPVIRRVVRVDDTTAVAIIHLHASRAAQGIVDSDIAWVAEFADGLLRRATAYPSVDGLPEHVRAALA